MIISFFESLGEVCAGITQRTNDLVGTKLEHMQVFDHLIISSLPLVQGSYLHND